MKLYGDRLKEERLGAGRTGARAGAWGTTLGRAGGEGAMGAGARRCDTATWGCDTTRVSATIRRWAGHDMATRARPRRGLCPQAELWLCTWFTWPVFDSVLFSESLIGHCS